MGISGALYSGVSGLNANGNAMSVIGNNIANANTIGFKSSRTLFGDILAGKVTASSGTVQIGRGTNLSTVDNVFTQGTFQNTETNSDLAIEGPGFFIVSDPSDVNDRSYTRAGAFRFDKEGNLVNPEGMKVMGFRLDEDGRTVGDLTPIRADAESFVPAGRTENIELNTNLDSDAVNLGVPFDRLDPDATSNYATSIQVYDSLGTTHLMTTYFTKTSAQAWEWNTVVNGIDIDPASGIAGAGVDDEFAVVGRGTLAFDASGDLIQIGTDADLSGTVDPATELADLYTVSGDTSSDPVVPRPTATVPSGNLPWMNGAEQDQDVAIDMQTTQYASPSVVVSQEQDGYGTGTLVKLTIDGDGNMIGNFSNGTPRTLMKLALAKFTNPNTLDTEGNNLYAETIASGVPVIGTVGSGVGTIFTNSLEQSNVDLAQEFVKMITTQRGFSANSKTITTTDEMLTEVINLKR